MGWVGLRFCEFNRCAKLKWNLEFCACISPSLYHSRLSLPSDRQRMPCCRTKQCHRQRRRTPLLPPAELNGIAELSERKGENGEDSKLRHRSMGVGAGTDCCMVFASFRILLAPFGSCWSLYVGFLIYCKIL